MKELFIIITIAQMTTQEIMGRLIAARKAKGLTQTELAEKLGISQVQLSKYESGISDMQLSKFLDVLKILDLDLLDFSESKNEETSNILSFIERQEKEFEKIKAKIKGKTL